MSGPAFVSSTVVSLSTFQSSFWGTTSTCVSTRHAVQKREPLRRSFTFVASSEEEKEKLGFIGEALVDAFADHKDPKFPKTGQSFGFSGDVKPSKEIDARVKSVEKTLVARVEAKVAELVETAEKEEKSLIQQIGEAIIAALSDHKDDKMPHTGAFAFDDDSMDQGEIKRRVKTMENAKVAKVKPTPQEEVVAVSPDKTFIGTAIEEGLLADHKNSKLPNTGDSGYSEKAQSQKEIKEQLKKGGY